MKNRKIISILFSIVFGVSGVLFLIVFFRDGYRSILEFLIGFCLIFIASYNVYLTLKHVKNEN